MAKKRAWHTLSWALIFIFFIYYFFFEKSCLKKWHVVLAIRWPNYMSFGCVIGTLASKNDVSFLLRSKTTCHFVSGVVVPFLRNNVSFLTHTKLHVVFSHFQPSAGSTRPNSDLVHKMGITWATKLWFTRFKRGFAPNSISYKSKALIWPKNTWKFLKNPKTFQPRFWTLKLQKRAKLKFQSSQKWC